MEIASNEFEIITNEIAKLKQAAAEFGENFVPIDLHTNLNVNLEESNRDAVEKADYDVNANKKTLELKRDLNKDDEDDSTTPVDPLALALALNRKNQAKMSSLLSAITIALEQNKYQMAQLKKGLSDTSEDTPMYKRRNMSLFGKPYFKDFEGSFPKPNPDTIAKKGMQEIDAFTRPSKPWTIEDNDTLLESVKNDFLQKKLRPLLSRKQIETVKYNNAADGTEERNELGELLSNIDKAIHAIKTSGKQLYGQLNEVHEVDWLKIANVDLKEQRSSESCRNFWRNVAHPLVNKLPWTPEEESDLVALAEKYKGRRWDKIANALGTGRSAFFCLLRYQTKFNPILQSKWSLRDDRKLERHVKSNTKKDAICWSKISKLMQSKSSLECKYRWSRIKGKVLNKTKWDKNLDRKLSQAVKVFGHNWMKVSRYVPGKDSAQCRDRYTNTLDESLKLGFWSHEEDTKLWRAVKVHKLDGQWARISQEYLPHRTDNQILIRYRRLLVYESKNNISKNKKSESSTKIESSKSQEESCEAPKRPKSRKKIHQKPQVDTKCNLKPPSKASPAPVEEAPPSPNVSYSLRKRSHEVSYMIDNDDQLSDSEDEACSPTPKKMRREDAAISNTQTVDSNTKTVEPKTKTVRPKTKTVRPKTQTVDPNTQTECPNTIDDVDPNTIDVDPSAIDVDPNTQVIDSSTEIESESSQDEISPGKQRDKKSNPDDEITEILCEFYRKKNKFFAYKAEQEDKPGFKKDIKEKFMNLLGNALKIPVSDQNTAKQATIPLLPPNRTSIQAFEYLMNSRKNLVNSAKVFQFPKNIKLPKPWERCQVEKFVDTSRTFGNRFLEDLSVNSKFSGELIFDKKSMAEEDEATIEHMRKVLLATKKEFPNEIFTKHTHASKIYRQIKVSEEYQSLQLKFSFDIKVHVSA